MAINLAKKYADKIASVFSQASLLSGRTSTAYDFTGVKSIVVTTPQTVPLGNYQRTGSNRYGTPTEMQDTTQEMIVTQDKSFSVTIDKGNNNDQQMIKNAGQMLRLEVQQEVVPVVDKYGFSRYVNFAGTIMGITKPDKTTIVSAIADGLQALDDALVPSDGRTIWTTAEMYKFIRLAPEFVGNTDLGKEAIAKGKVGEFDSTEVVKVPSSYLPSGCYFLITFRDAILLPYKINDSKVTMDPPGLSGALLEGRSVFDAFVLGAKAKGIYAAVSSANIQAAPTNAYSTNSLTMSSSGATTILFTLDGTDPRYSSTAFTYSAAINPVTLTAGTQFQITAGQQFTVNSVAMANGKFTSPVATNVFTA